MREHQTDCLSESVMFMLYTYIICIFERSGCAVLSARSAHELTSRWFQMRKACCHVKGISCPE